MKLFILISVTALVFGASACNRAPETKEAVRQAVIDHVASRVNLTSMDVDVTAVTFRGDEATASVDFRPKGGAAGSGVLMNYTLEKKAGKWMVKGKGADSGGSPHGGAAPQGGAPSGMPPGHPPMPQAPPAQETPKDSPKK